MSIIKVNRIENTSTTDGGIDVDTSGHVTIDGQQFPTAGPLSNRNLIINGAMQVAQRGTSATVTTNTQTYPCVDRFKIELSQTSPNYTYSQDTDAPDGFVNSFKILNNATASQGSTGTLYNLVGQNVEQNVADFLGWGTSWAKQATVSFWIKSNVTGSDIVELIIRRNGTVSNDSIALQITINSANTWEYKTITIPATTTDIGKPANNSLAFNLFFSFQGIVGSNKIASYGTWDNNNRLGGPAGDTNVFAATPNAYMNITGVQLEVGSKATPFEHRSYGDELVRCQRYYTKFTATAVGERIGVGYVDATTQAVCLLHFPVEMRSNPASLDQSGTASDYSVANSSVNVCTSVPTFSIACKNTANIVFNVNTGITGAARDSIMARYNSTNAFFGFSAEL